ncbi:MAG: ABC transporter substrate-binding protein, partial [Acidimicrobiia bacterium]
MKRVSKALAALLALAMIATACGGDDGESLSVASILPLTGDLADFGPSMENAVQLAVDQVNAAGGVHGSDVTLFKKDSGTAEDVARTSANEAIAEGVQAILGGAGSGVTLSLTDLLSQNEIVQISGSATSPQLTSFADNGFLFRTAISDDLQGQVLARLLEDEGVSSVAIMARNDSYGQGLSDAFTAAFSGTVASRQDYDATATSFDAEVSNLASAGVTDFICICFPGEGTVIHQSAFEQGLFDGTRWFYTDGLKDDPFPEAAFPDNPGQLSGFLGTFPTSSDDPAVASALDQFTADYVAAFGSEPGPFAVQFYDAALLVMLAAESSDGTGVGIRDAMQSVSSGGTACSLVDCLELAADGEDIDFIGATGGIEFDSNGDPQGAFYEIWQFNDAGNTESVRVIDASILEKLESLKRKWGRAAPLPRKGSFRCRPGRAEPPWD